MPTGRYEVAPGVTRLRMDRPRQTPPKRIAHWLTAQLAKRRKAKPIVGEQQALF